jgi:glycerophosphoryl diester phosphodiesterase
VDEEEMLETIFSMGADAVASNRPDLAVAVRDRVVAAQPR